MTITKSKTESNAERGRAKSANFQLKVRAAMRDIDEETKRNGGIYPNNEGKVSRAHLAEKAQVNPTSFHTDQQATFRAEVNLWIAGFSRKAPATKSEAKVSYQEKFAELILYIRSLETNFRLVELELQDRDQEIEKLTALLAERRIVRL